MQTKTPRPLDADFVRLMAMAFTTTDLARMPPDQLRECRRFFFAGAKALFRLINEGMQPDGEVTADEEALVAAVEAELEQFGIDLQEGRA